MDLPSHQHQKSNDQLTATTAPSFSTTTPTNNCSSSSRDPMPTSSIFISFDWPRGQSTKVFGKGAMYIETEATRAILLSQLKPMTGVQRENYRQQSLIATARHSRIRASHSRPLRSVSQSTPTDPPASPPPGYPCWTVSVFGPHNTYH